MSIYTRVEGHTAGAWYKRAFTLLELSIVLAIIGVLLGMVLSTIHRDTPAMQYGETRTKMQAISKAIAQYVAVHGALPCPANPSLPSTAANSGVSNCAYTVTNTALLAGAVPIQTLGLPTTFLADAWGSAITYVVAQPFHTVDGFARNNQGNITIEDNASAPHDQSAVYVLISHGVNRQGAWPKDGGKRNPVSTSPHELQNSETPYNTNPPIYIHRLPEPTSKVIAGNLSFDDVVLFRSKDRLVAETGALFAGVECATAKLALRQANTSATTNMCTTTPSELPGNPDCPFFTRALANALDQRCFTATMQ